MSSTVVSTDNFDFKLAGGLVKFFDDYFNISHK